MRKQIPHCKSEIFVLSWPCISVKGCSSQSDLVLLDEGLFPPHIAARYGQSIKKFPQYQPPVEVTARLRDSPGLKRPNPRQSEDWKHVLKCTPLRSFMAVDEMSVDIS